MPSSEVTVVMTAQNAELVRAWMQAKEGPQGMEKELQKVARAGKKAGKETKDAMDEASSASSRAISAFAGIASAAGAATTIIAIMRNEIEATIARSKEISKAQISLGPTIAKTSDILGGFQTNLTTDGMLRRFREEGNGVPVEELFNAWNEASSALGNGQSPEDAENAVIASARLRPYENADTRSKLVAGSLQLAQATGQTPEVAMATSARWFTQSRAKDAGSFYENTMPTIMDLHRLSGGKDDINDLAALTIGYGKAANDPTGAMSRTALMGISKQAMEVAKKHKLVGDDATIKQSLDAISKRQAAQDELLGVFAKDVGVVDPESLKRRIKAGKGELRGGEATFAASMSLVSGQGAVVDEMAAFRSKGIRLDASSVVEVEAQNKKLFGSESMRSAEIDRMRRESGERDIGKDSGVLESEMALRASIRAKAGMGVFDRQIQEWGDRGRFMLHGTTPDDARTETLAIAKQLQSRQDSIFKQDGIITQSERERQLDLARLIEAVEKQTAIMEEGFRQPQPVRIEADSRPPTQPQQPALKRLNDG